jgi:Ala-tRNA(Pro) deacylase
LDDKQTIERKLADGSEPAMPDDVFAKLDSLGIEHRTVSHRPLRTVEDSKGVREGVPGGYSKNLFLRNKKGRMILVTLHEDRVVNLKALGELLEMGKPSFASPQRLMHYLGVIPGAVTPLAVINDTGHQVTAILDKMLLDLHPLHFHPGDNSMTTTLAATDLLQYMRSCHSEPVIIDFDRPELTAPK